MNVQKNEEMTKYALNFKPGVWNPAEGTHRSDFDLQFQTGQGRGVLVLWAPEPDVYFMLVAELDEKGVWRDTNGPKGDDAVPDVKFWTMLPQRPSSRLVQEMSNWRIATLDDFDPKEAVMAEIVAAGGPGGIGVRVVKNRRGERIGKCEGRHYVEVLAEMDAGDESMLIK